MRSLTRLAVLPVLALALAACGSSGDDSPGSGSPTSATPAPSRGVPAGVEETLDSPAGVAVGEEGQIHVITYGSSTNPAVVNQVSAEGQKVVVQVSPEEGRPATMDYVPTTSTFELPEGVDTDEPVTFVLGAFGTVVLDAIEPGQQAWVERAE
ncbi:MULTISPECIES: hypothetical protein [Aeromicrobium]|uniref:hypothetical protein n=1 Tax=Aeromicrobium TaxID=2040 RepID=UPI00257C8840|nr:MULTISPECIES: hypothetical protein [Aeromicrobium]